MTTSVKSMMAEANAAVDKLDRAGARTKMEEGALVLDVRDGDEVARDGHVPGARNVSRGMLEFRADPDSPFYDDAFDKDRPVLLYCASGGRSALAGKVLLDMGYREVWNIGGFKEWAEDGGPIEGAAAA